MAKEHYYDRLNEKSENRKRISEENINKYVATHKHPKEPVFEDFYLKELARGPPPSQGGYGTLMRSAAVATMGGIATYVAVKYI